MTSRAIEKTKIYQILRPKLSSVEPSLSVRAALNVMHQDKAGYLVIADKHKKILGMFTEVEVLMKVLRPNVDLAEPVKKYMPPNPRTLTRQHTVGEAINVMKEHGVRHVPLADEKGRLDGVLSVRTVVTFLSEFFPTEIYNLPPKADQIHQTPEGG